MTGRILVLATLLGLVSVPAAADGGQGSERSPLLTYDATGQTAWMQALGGGILTRDGDCLYLVVGGSRTLLVLPSPQASWDSARGTIRLAGHELRLGQEIAIGGGMSEGGIASGPVADEARRRGCDTGRVWWGSPELVDARRLRTR